ncbi:dynamin family protein [Alicyclobacillus tolerans]|uniref:dynamin family protein n=1 Tax=Alicyclobacillus tolerans TaxID=90970 RepID=UPI001F3C5BA7|nr:dynamin family protein [Alicyclobacillus tolerans]MCF8566114.1 dynamin family protein [Alicyclobacillus tolerans]
MTQAEMIQDKSAWLSGIQARLERIGDEVLANRVGDLADRARRSQSQVYVAFCGLFSAGKSTLLNHLSDGQELATGAVPTTASTAEVTLPQTHGQVVLIDTPGVDSTDERHQAETQAALHRADLIALVMDYQHVESDSNLELARWFSEQGKRLILVVNQIDKHLDWELSFDEFQQRVRQSLEDYGIVYERIFYTSAENCEHNEFESLLDWLRRLQANAASTAEASLVARVRELVEEHVERSLAPHREAVEQRMRAAAGLVPFDQDEANRLVGERKQRLEEIERELLEHQQKLDQGFAKQREEFVRSVELAQIAPYETTERGRMFVESLRPEFSVGWFKRKEKTQQEQNARLTEFVKDLSDRTEKYLMLPLTNNLRKFVQENALAHPDWLTDVAGLQVSVTPELCQSTIRPGALVSNQYPYQYVKDVVSAIKRSVLGQINVVFDRWLERAREAQKTADEAQRAAAAQLTVEVEALQAWLGWFFERDRQVNDLLHGGLGQDAEREPVEENP